MSMSDIAIRRAEGWPEPATVPLVSRNRKRLYATPEGEFPSVTTILRVLGLSTDALVAWSANQERAAILEACGTVYAAGEYDDGPAGFIAAVEQQIGTARQHQKLITKAADIGTAAHQCVQWQLRKMLGLPVGPEPVLADASRWAVMAFEDFWRESRLTPIRSEQPVWDAALGYAGTVDIIAEHPDRGPGIIDIKTSRGIYDDHHLQVAAYCHAARNWSDINWAMLVRLPKNTDDPAFETKQLGQLYGGRVIAEADLFEAFKAALTAWRVLLA